MGLKRAFTTNEKMEGGKSDERTVIKGKRTEGEDYLIRVRGGKRLGPYHG